MPLLLNPQVLQIQARAVDDGLDQARDALLAGLPPAYVAGLKQNPAPAAQLLLDLSAMNRDGVISDNLTPLVEWLRAAAALTGGRPARSRFYEDLTTSVASKAAAAAAASGGGAGGGETDLRVPERILFRDTLLPASFLAGALRTARSVARLVVPVFRGGAPRLTTSADKPLRFFGTGWLIGPQHVMTSWHVVEARLLGEQATPDPEDVRLQWTGAAVEFDYEVENVPAGLVARVAALEHYDAALDYAVLRLEGMPSGREPLPLRDKPVVLAAEEPFPVNIVQHPAGAAKQLGLRNNLASSLTETELTYFTDTASGSSGSPVCDDAWRVVALHRGTRPLLRALNFQGKQTAWINSGTPIRPIVADLRANAASLWEAVGATLV